MTGESMKLTKFDSQLTSPSMEMAKAVIPYIEPKTANMLGLFIKLQELQNAAQLNFSSFSQENNPESSSENLFADLRNFLGDNEKEQLDFMMSMMELLKTMNPEDLNLDQYMNIFQ
jgi:hypothetical protein